VHLVGFTVGLYYDVRSYKRQILTCILSTTDNFLNYEKMLTKYLTDVTMMACAAILGSRKVNRKVC
jgi:hypothetical protein